jgi:hypothetical protein
MIHKGLQSPEPAKKKMRSAIYLLAFLMGGLAFSNAEETAPQQFSSPVQDIVILRTGEQFQAPHVITYHLVEIAQQRGKWLVPDFGAIDYGKGNFRELFIGGGPIYHYGKMVTYNQELFFAQDNPAQRLTGRATFGPGRSSTSSSLPGSPPRLSPTLCIPLNRAAYMQYDLDRAKLEYAVSRRLIAGGGLSLAKNAGHPWENKSFITTTVSTRHGTFEFWLQKTPGGGQIQMRYQLVHTRH